MDDNTTSFLIGQHNPKVLSGIPSIALGQSNDAGYDTVTVPITTSHFHTRVLALLSTCVSSQTDSTQRQSGEGASFVQPGPIPTIPPLQPVDSNLSPEESLSHIIAVSSSWIDLCSPDPLIAGISRQVLLLEIAYAAFCGITYILIPGPRWPYRNPSDGALMQYARALQTALESAPYLQFHIWNPLIDHPSNDEETVGDIGPFARPEYLPLDTEAKKMDLFGSWDTWNVVRSLCKYHARLSIALRLPKHLPPVAIQSRWYSEPVKILSLDHGSFTKNAKGYPVLSKAHQALITRYFRLKTPPWFLLCHVDPIPIHTTVDGPTNTNLSSPLASNPPQSATDFPTLAEAANQANGKHADGTPYLSYMRNLQKKQPQLSPIERFGAGYQDYLQAPLQPLTVNLESITYEVFEKDPIKYEWYERAISKALRDWLEQRKPTSREDGRVVVAVVGAGRGPLVTRALKAADEAGISIDMWALEKNPNAFVLLNRHNETIWNNRVKLVQSDMRTWKGPWVEEDYRNKGMPLPETSIGQAISSLADVADSAFAVTATMPRVDFAHEPTVKHYPIDILISELLGSFADNELSPECLDGVTHLLNPVHGISIPASYTAHLSPIGAPKLHADIMAQSISNPHAAETPYVVMFHAVDHLSTTVQSSSVGNKSPTPNMDGADRTSSMIGPPVPVVQTVWKFSHPNSVMQQMSPDGPPVSNSHNSRHSVVSFRIRDRGVCHGIAGYFETVLYPGVELSTNPVTMEQKSAGMISWFPTYFPLKQPLYVPDNSVIVLHMWRQTDERKVWYEWIVEVFVWDRVDAARAKGPGKKLRIGMSELHSSIKEACLM